ncbi:MAG: DNA-binding protein [Deltaproteobacteria bacterium HGW-Deltaproteobacteria-15]|jgi:predicted DNA-binding transcriptional regulator AlpA|nr:MAG: DNA-binding protein [Deltaproteobacteria bacterium HGW-Deltaproteobacteria-15]
MPDFLLPQEKEILRVLKEQAAESEPLLKPEELAQALKVSLTWIYARSRVRGEGAMPCIRCGKYLRFRLSDVLAWLKEQN